VNGNEIKGEAPRAQELQLLYICCDERAAVQNAGCAVCHLDCEINEMNAIASVHADRVGKSGLKC
jgi:hypothetical protein